MKKRVCVLIVAAALVFSHGCGWFTSDSSDIVATVGGKKLTKDDLDQMLQIGSFQEKSADARRRAVTRWINRELLFQEALRKKVNDDPGVQLQIETARRDIMVSALVDRLQKDAASVSDEEIQQYFEENKGVFKRAEASVHARQIIVENAAEARRIASEVARRPETFEQVARTRSSDPSSADGGDIGFVTARTAYSQDIWLALQRLADNEISRPIAIDAGLVIVQAVEHRPAGSAKSLDEVRSEVVNRVRAAHRATLMAALAESLKLKENVEVFTERIGLPSRTPQGGSVSGEEQ